MDDPRADPCDFLDPIHQAEAAPAFRAALWQKTLGVLTRKRWRRRAGLAAALAACYLAGLGTMRLWVTVRTDGMGPAAGQRTAAAEPVQKPPTALLVSAESVPAVELEKIASLVPAGQRAGWYRQAGDRYWQETGDLQSALRCYRLALAAGAEKDWIISVEDNWLLMALKQAKQKEKNHANADG